MTTSKEQNMAKKIWTTHDYVQDGLIACWDGIENIGRERRSVCSSQWVDVIGGHVFNLQDDSKSKFTWEPDGLKRSGFGGLAGSFPDLALPSPSAPYSIEVIISCPRFQWPLAQEKVTGGFIMWNKLNGGMFMNNTVNQVYFSPYGSYYFGGAYLEVPFNKISLAFAKNTTPEYRNLGWCAPVYKNGQWIADCWDNMSFTGDLALFGVYSGDWKFENEIVMHAIRVYSRDISSDEIAHNFEIDKVRFDI